MSAALQQGGTQMPPAQRTESRRPQSVAALILLVVLSALGLKADNAIRHGYRQKTDHSIRHGYNVPTDKSVRHGYRQKTDHSIRHGYK